MLKYKLLSLPLITINDGIYDSFENLPVDEFLNIDEPYQYRYRRYGSGEIANNKLVWKTDSDSFTQDKKINQYAGNISREFPPLDSLLRDFIQEKIIFSVVGKVIPKAIYAIGAHQIRITANNKYMGKPAPEGIHQDGFDYVAVTCVNSDNVVGGNSILVDSNDYKKTFLEKELTPGEILIFDDKAYAHYASPIVPKIPGNCYRDVIVTTYKQLESLKIEENNAIK